MLQVVPTVKPETGPPVHGDSAIEGTGLPSRNSVPSIARRLTNRASFFDRRKSVIVQLDRRTLLNEVHFHDESLA